MIASALLGGEARLGERRLAVARQPLDQVLDVFTRAAALDGRDGPVDVFVGKRAGVGADALDGVEVGAGGVGEGEDHWEGAALADVLDGGGAPAGGEPVDLRPQPPRCSEKGARPGGRLAVLVAGAGDGCAERRCGGGEPTVGPLDDAHIVGRVGRVLLFDLDEGVLGQRHVEAALVEDQAGVEDGFGGETGLRRVHEGEAGLGVERVAGVDALRVAPRPPEGGTFRRAGVALTEVAVDAVEAAHELDGRGGGHGGVARASGSLGSEQAEDAVGPVGGAGGEAGAVGPAELVAEHLGEQRPAFAHGAP